MFTTTADLIAFLVICTVLVLLLITLITLFILKFQQRRISYIKSIKDLNTNHSNELLKAAIEVQEQTFQNISREIHDNICQKLTLAKLQLNILPRNTFQIEALENSIDILSVVLKDLSDLSRSTSSEIIKGNGLHKAVEFEISQLNKLKLYDVRLKIFGEPYYLHEQKELVIFRIIQEALNNVVKHANATKIEVNLTYNMEAIYIEIKDNGIGLVNLDSTSIHLGLKNMARRTEFLKGSFQLNSKEYEGTIININIPTNERKETNICYTN